MILTSSKNRYFCMRQMLRLDSNLKNKTTNAQTAIPNQNEDPKIIDIIKKCLLFIIIPIVVGIILLKIEYGWFNSK